MFVEIAYCPTTIGTHMAQFSRDNPVLECVRLSCCDVGTARGVTKISHKLYQDITSTGGRHLIMFWEIHSHDFSTVFGPTNIMTHMAIYCRELSNFLLFSSVTHVKSCDKVIPMLPTSLVTCYAMICLRHLPQNRRL